MATVNCSCGAVTVKFNNSKCLFRVECCCYNCTNALAFCATKGGPAAPKHQCIDSFFFSNDLTIEKGEDKIGAFLSFEGADTTRFYCKDCWSCVIGDHPAYRAKVCVTQSPSLSGAELMPPQARHYQADLKPDQLAAINKDLPWTGDPAHGSYQGAADNVMAKFPEMLEQGATGEQMNCQTLLEKCGPALIPEDPSGILTGGPPTFLQKRASAWAEK